MPFFDTFSCCNSLLFLHLPFLGYTELYLSLLVIVCILFTLSLLRAFLHARSLSSALSAPYLSAPSLAVVFLLLAVALYTQLHTPSSSSSVLSWIQALDMARVDDDSVALHQWCAAQTPSSAASSFTTEPTLVQVLTAQEANYYANKVKENRKYWIHMNERAGPLPAFTYGAYWMYLSFAKQMPSAASVREWARVVPKVTLQDLFEKMEGGAVTSRLRYEEAVGAYNEHFREEYGPVYDKVRAALQEVLRSEVVYAADNDDDNDGDGVSWALPGFNIQLHHRVFQEDVYQAHIDGTGSPVRFSYSDSQCSDSKRTSFTLALETTEGTGLDYWMLDDQLCSVAYVNEQVSQGCGNVARCFVKKRLEYKPGYMAVHEGALIHGVGAWRYDGGASKARITMQAFSAFCDGKLRFFF